MDYRLYLRYLSLFCYMEQVRAIKLVWKGSDCMGAEVTQKKQPPKRNKPFEFYYKYAVEYFKRIKP